MGPRHHIPFLLPMLPCTFHRTPSIQSNMSQWALALRSFYVRRLCNPYSYNKILESHGTGARIACSYRFVNHVITLQILRTTDNWGEHLKLHHHPLVCKSPVTGRPPGRRVLMRMQGSFAPTPRSFPRPPTPNLVHLPDLTPSLPNEDRFFPPLPILKLPFWLFINRLSK